MTLTMLAAATLLNPTVKPRAASVAWRARATEQDERLQGAGR